MSTLQAARANRAEKEARQERDAATRARQQAEAINRFLTEDLLYQATPEQNAREKSITMEQVLERAAHRLDENPQITREPELEATLRLAVGETFRQLGDWIKAEQYFRRAVSLRTGALGSNHLETLLARKYLACLLSVDMAEWNEEALQLSLATWQGLKQVVESTPRGSFDSRIYRAALDAESAYINLLANTKSPEHAARLKRENVAAYERVFGTEDHGSITALHDLAVELELAGDFAEAERTYREAGKRFERTGQMDSADGLMCVYNAGWCRFLQGDSAGARSILLDARSRAARIFIPDHPILLDIQHRLARVLIDEGRWDDAEELIKTTLGARRRVLPPNNGRTAYSMVVLARVLLERGKLPEAESLLTEARTVFRNHYATQPRLLATAENWLGAVHLARHDYVRAENLLVPLADEFLLPTIEMSPRERRDCLSHLVRLYQGLDHPEKSDAWQRRIDALNKLTAPQEDRPDPGNPK
jgi:tetratricopeptide (TPR) repeat protein